MGNVGDRVDAMKGQILTIYADAADYPTGFLDQDTAIPMADRPQWVAAEVPLFDSVGISGGVVLFRLSESIGSVYIARVLVITA